MAASIEITGHLHGLARKIGKIGGEHITMAITSKDLDKWNRLIGVTEGDVAITISAQQAELPGTEDSGGGGENGVGRRKRKEPTDGRASAD